LFALHIIERSFVYLLTMGYHFAQHTNQNQIIVFIVGHCFDVCVCDI